TLRVWARHVERAGYFPASTAMSNPVPDAVLRTLAEHAADADAEPVWPAASWEALRTGGVPGWSVPREYGGLGWDGPRLLDGYEQPAGACLTTTFLLSQREAAVRRLRDSNNEAIRRELLPALAEGRTLATVGLSQLTTSRQHGQPALEAEPAGDGFLFRGN